MSDAMIGYDLLIEVRDSSVGGAYTALDECFEFTPPASQISEVEVTHFKSPGRRREYVAGLTDSGTASLQMNYVPGSASDVLIEGARSAGTIWDIRAVYPNGVSVEFTGFVQEYTPAAPLDDRLTATVGLRVSGNVTVVAATTPVNTIPPYILGSPKVGDPLTAWPGVWSGNGVFTYQWSVGGSPVSGATGATYTPVAGDAGDPVLVTVTCTNSAGNASAPSDATGNVAS